MSVDDRPLIHRRGPRARARRGPSASTPSASRSPRRSTASSPRTCARRRRSPVPVLGHGRLRGARRPRRPDAHGRRRVAGRDPARRRRVGRRGGDPHLDRRRRPRRRRRGDPPGGRRDPAAARSRRWPPCRPGRTSAAPARTCRAGTVVLDRGHPPRAAGARGGGRRRGRGGRGRPPPARPGPVHRATSSASPASRSAPGEIHNSNGPMLAALARRAGAADAAARARCPTTAPATEAALGEALAGRRRRGHLRRRLGRAPRPRQAGAGGAWRRGGFWRVALQPGKPDLVRDARRPARVRAAGQPGLGRRDLLAVRAPGARRPPGRPRPDRSPRPRPSWARPCAASRRGSRPMRVRLERRRRHRRRPSRTARRART